MSDHHGPAAGFVPFVSVENMMHLILDLGVERCLTELTAYIEDDFKRWDVFDKQARVRRTPAWVSRP